jgi:hypothetical protein
MSRIFRSFVAFAAAFALAGPVAAQQIAPASGGGAAQQPAPASGGGAPELVMPRATSTLFAGPQASDTLSFPAGQVIIEARLESALLASAQRARAPSTALMLIGGAAMVAGALVDGDAGTIIMVGGGAVALVGLWRYLQ